MTKASSSGQGCTNMGPGLGLEVLLLSQEMVLKDPELWAHSEFEWVLFGC